MQYRASPEKHIVSTQFDRPLVVASHRLQGRPLRYFGLPGEEALDLRTWGDLLDYVAAVEFSPDRMRVLERHLDTYYSHIRYRTHLGDADMIILKNGSRLPGRRGAGSWQHVPVTYHPDAGYIWDFDVVYLDYFGKFLPYDRGTPQVQNRARALRHLFASDRENAWQPWLLMVTVESRLFGADDREQMRDYLSAARRHVGSELVDVLDYLLYPGVDRTLQAARLVRGTLAYIISIAASNADVAVYPRPTVLYSGSRGLPMLHFAYHIVPRTQLSVHQHALPLLRAPFLQITNPAEWPWFQLLPEQPPGQTETDVRSAFDFLENAQVDQILAGAA